MRYLFFIICLPFVTFAQQSDFANIDFSMADQSARRHKGETLYNLPVLAHNLTYNLTTDVERFRAIYYWVTHNIKGDYSRMEENIYYRNKFSNNNDALEDWHRLYKKTIFDNLIKNKKTVCTGYSYLVQQLSKQVDIEIQIINGYTPLNKRSTKKKDIPSHSWIAVKLNNKWYLCDPTWAAGYTDLDNYVFIYDYDNSYFLQNPIDFAKDHTPITVKWTLLEDSINQ